MRYSINKNKYLLPPEVDALKHLIGKHFEQDLRNCLLLSLALNTGARAQEILNIRRVDINSYDQSIFIHGIKGSNDRELPIAPQLFKKLDLYLVKKNEEKTDSARAKSDRVFDLSYQRLNQIWDFYRPVQKKFHALRHTFAIQLYHKTKDLRLVQVALGHRSINNTMVYADYIYTKQELKKLIL